MTADITEENSKFQCGKFSTDFTEGHSMFRCRHFTADSTEEHFTRILPAATFHQMRQLSNEVLLTFQGQSNVDHKHYNRLQNAMSMSFSVENWIYCQSINMKSDVNTNQRKTNFTIDRLQMQCPCPSVWKTEFVVSPLIWNQMSTQTKEKQTLQLQIVNEQVKH